MKVLVVGKFPPIEGGVSAQTYWLVNQLAARGHQVSVITNAREVESAYRSYMRPEDWARCESDAAGNIRVHWTAPLDKSQWHIPFDNPSVTKLVSLGLQAARESRAELVFSFYLEPYAVAGHLIAQELGIPHVIKTAGSDVGRLWSHPQYKPLYDQIFRRAAAIWTAPSVRKVLIEENGLDPDSIQTGGVLAAPGDLFRPDGDALDLTSLLNAITEDPDWRGAPVFGEPREDLQYFGMYGKIAADKGVYELLEAITLVRAEVSDVGLLLMGSAYDRELRKLRGEIEKLGLENHVVHIPFLPHWYVPQFIRRCFAVCCLEREFSIALHSPVIAREVMLCGGCLVGSTEILRKMPKPELLIDRYNCVAIENVKDTRLLADRLTAMVKSPELAMMVQRRAGYYAASIVGTYDDGASFERLLTRGLKPKDVSIAGAMEIPPSWLRAIQLVYEKLESRGTLSFLPTLDATGYRLWASEVLNRLACGKIAQSEIWPYQHILRICIILSSLMPEQSASDGEKKNSDLFYRFRPENWAASAEDMLSIANFKASAIGEIIVERFEIDVGQVLASIRAAKLPEWLDRVETYLVIQSGVGREARLFVVDRTSAVALTRLLVRSSIQIGAEFSPDEHDQKYCYSLKILLECGLISLTSS